MRHKRCGRLHEKLNLTTRALEVLAGYLSFTDGPKTAPNAGLNVSSWPIATGDILTARRRFLGNADMDRFSSHNDL